MGIKLPLLIFLLGPLGLAQEPPVYVNNLSAEAQRAMEKISTRDPKALSEAELVEWARARLAWVALLRLQGREKDALQVFGGCAEFCEKFGPEREWAAAKSWGCPKKREAKPCLSSSSNKKTKAQKPSR